MHLGVKAFAFLEKWNNPVKKGEMEKTALPENGFVEFSKMKSL